MLVIFTNETITESFEHLLDTKNSIGSFGKKQ